MKGKLDSMKENNKMTKTIYLMTLKLFLDKNNFYDNSTKLFPLYWGKIDNDYIKTNILNEAMEKNIKIEDTNEYRKYLDEISE